MVVTRDNLLQVNLAEALNRTNQAMGSEKKLDGGKRRASHITCSRYKIPVKFI
jgi:hypothetical protein